MDTNLVLIVVVTIILIIAFALSKGRRRRVTGYRKRAYLLSKAERSFYGVLMKAVDGRYSIFSKVRVADVLAPQKGLSRSAWQVAFNKVSAKHFDFVLCDPGNLSIQFVVELNDSSHKSRSRSQRDEFLRGACASAGVNLIEVEAKASYAVEQIRALIMTADKIGSGASLAAIRPDGRREPTIS